MNTKTVLPNLLLTSVEFSLFTGLTESGLRNAVRSGRVRPVVRKGRKMYRAQDALSMRRRRGKPTAMEALQVKLQSYFLAQAERDMRLAMDPEAVASTTAEGPAAGRSGQHPGTRGKRTAGTRRSPNPRPATRDLPLPSDVTTQTTTN